MVEAAGHLDAVLPEALVAEGADGPAKAADLRVNPGRPDGDRLARMVLALLVSNLFYDAHYFSVAQVAGVGDEHFVLRVDYGLLDDVHLFGGDEPFGPLGGGVGLAQEALGYELAGAYLAVHRVLAQDVFAVGVGVPDPEPLSHLVPGEVEQGGRFEISGHGAGTTPNEKTL